MTKIILTRHGHVEGIKPERFRGRQPLELTALGRSQADVVAKRIAAAWQPSAIFTSPMGRCVETAAAIGKACGVAASPCADLNDIDYGAWTFKTFEQAKEEDPTLFSAWFAMPQRVRFPGGESLQDLAARTANALRMVLARNSDENVVLVGHDSVNRVLLLQLLAMPLSSYWSFAQDPCCLNEVDVGGETIRVRRINETGHLEA